MEAKEKELERLSHKKFIDWISQDVPVSQMLEVYRWQATDDGSVCILCGLIPNSKVKHVLSDFAWDLHIGNGLPGSVISYNGGKKEKVEYLRFGNNYGIEPLVFKRDFHGIKNNYMEISEEFRHFHNLYHDRTNNKYIAISDSGNEEDVILIEPNSIQIRLKEIKQFLAIKEMHLAIFFDCREYSQHLLQDLSISSKSTDVKNKLLSYNLAYGDSGGISGWKCFSRLCGKKLIPGFSKENSCFWGFAKEEPKKYVDFIRGIDKNGKEILYSSNPSGLSNSYFDKNPTTPDYLTPVFFKKEVLDKYYQQPNKYSVEDGYLRCSGLWGVQIDNHHRDKVIVWLGDLGRDLPYQDQLHWRSYNIPPLGGVSETFFKRQILAQFADTDQPDLVFKHKYENFQVASQKKLGWYLFRPLLI